jgi:hypothetical protein
MDSRSDRDRDRDRDREGCRTIPRRGRGSYIRGDGKEPHWNANWSSERAVNGRQPASPGGIWA